LRFAFIGSRNLSVFYRKYLNISKYVEYVSRTRDKLVKTFPYSDTIRHLDTALKFIYYCICLLFLISLPALHETSYVIQKKY